MTYVSLYRKWRPQTFSQLVGQDHIARTLANSIGADRVAHAYLFAGPRGTGKTSTAKILAKSVNCEAGPTPEPCGKCRSCLAIATGNSLDVFEMDAASNRGIDEIRDLRDKVAFAATAGKHKVYIIDEVHMLTEPAFNALLKTLEEPPTHVIFILATTDPNKVPVTISSRCQHFEFRRIPLPALISHLKTVSKAEKIAVAEDALAIIARQAEGSLRDALGMLDQLAAYSDKEIGAEEAIKFLGLIDSSLVETCVDLVLTGQSGAIFEFVQSLTETGRDIRQFTGALLAHLRDLFVLAQVDGIERRRQLVNAADEDIEKMAAKAESLGVPKIRSLLTTIGRLYEGLRTAAEPRLSLELALISLMRGDELTIEAIADRLSLLEAGRAVAPVQFAQPKTSAPKAPSKPPETVASKKPVATGGSIDLDQVQAAWGDIVNRAKRKKLSLGAYLIEGRPTAVNELCLTITFEPKSNFAYQELVKKPHAELLKEVLGEVFGTALAFTAAVGEEQAVQASPPPIADRPVDPEIPDVSDEPDVLDLIKASFGAEVVDE